MDFPKDLDYRSLLNIAEDGSSDELQEIIDNHNGCQWPYEFCKLCRELHRETSAHIFWFVASNPDVTDKQLELILNNKIHENENGDFYHAIATNPNLTIRWKELLIERFITDEKEEIDMFCKILSNSSFTTNEINNYIQAREEYFVYDYLLKIWNFIKELNKSEQDRAIYSIRAQVVLKGDLDIDKFLK